MSNSSSSPPAVNKDNKALILPLHGTRKLMRLNNEVAAVSQEAVAVVAKATELFAVLLAEEARDSMVISNKKIIKVRIPLPPILLRISSFSNVLFCSFCLLLLPPPGWGHPRSNQRQSIAV